MRQLKKWGMSVIITIAFFAVFGFGGMGVTCAVEYIASLPPQILFTAFIVALFITVLLIVRFTTLGGRP